MSSLTGAYEVTWCRNVALLSPGREIRWTMIPAAQQPSPFRLEGRGDADVAGWRRRRLARSVPPQHRW